MAICSLIIVITQTRILCFNSKPIIFLFAVIVALQAFTYDAVNLQHR